MYWQGLNYQLLTEYYSMPDSIPQSSNTIELCIWILDEFVQKAVNEGNIVTVGLKDCRPCLRTSRLPLEKSFLRKRISVSNANLFLKKNQFKIIGCLQFQHCYSFGLCYGVVCAFWFYCSR